MSFIEKNKANLTHMLTVLAIIVLVLLDLGTKRRVFQTRPEGTRLTPIFNTGAAWSLALPISLLIITSIIFCWVLIVFYAKKHIARLPFILLMAGALGNIYDRIVFHGVRDWISISSFPVFNIADVLITAAVVLVAFAYKTKSRTERAK